MSLSTDSDIASPEEYDCDTCHRSFPDEDQLVLHQQTRNCGPNQDEFVLHKEKHGKNMDAHECQAVRHLYAAGETVSEIAFERQRKEQSIRRHLRGDCHHPDQMNIGPVDLSQGGSM